MTELIVDIGDIQIPDGFRKDRGVYKTPSGPDTFLGLDGTIMCHSNFDTRRIVLIPEPKPYVWPPWCKLWGATIDQVNGVIKLWERPPAQSEFGWNWNGGVIVFADQWKASGLTPPTRDHFTDWKTPLLKPHWKGE